MHMARDHLADPELIQTKRDITVLEKLDDIQAIVIDRFQDLLLKEDLNGDRCRFGWGL